ncbi:unnamed protein product [Trichobilharzia regenti]|nr:unnamed protein product [Trichobilharzia regenti]
MSSKTKYCRRGMSSQFGSPLRILTICLFFLVSLVHGIMDDNTRSILLSLHNGVRHMVLIGKIKGQPKAVSMEQLKWNVELERKAKVLSSQCRDGHDTPEDRKIPGFSYVGQNRAGADTVES